jgi:hypothetical protein
VATLPTLRMMVLPGPLGKDDDEDDDDDDDDAVDGVAT